LYFKVLWKYDDWSFRFHHFLENGWFCRENTYKCSPLVTQWQIILHFTPALIRDTNITSVFHWNVTIWLVTWL
jgi:hypothetical protein